MADRAALADSFDQTDSLSANTIRMLAADMVEKANSGHPGMPMGFAVAAHVLWSRHLVFNPDNPFWPGRDRFILSCGHGSALLYSLLHLGGYDLPMDQLKQFRQWGSITPGHPEFGMTPGVEMTAGPLGEGLSSAVGMAMAQRYIREKLEVYGKEFDPLDHRIYVIASDGDLQEGASSEASSLAGRQKLDRLTVLYDDNRITIDGTTDLSWNEDVCARYEAYGWHVINDVDGNDPEEIDRALRIASEVTEQPSLIAIQTTIGQGSPNKQNTSSVHGAPLGAEEMAATREALGWEFDPFTVPDETYARYAVAAERGRDLHEEWLEKLERWLAEDDSRAELWEQLVHGAMPEGWDEALPGFEGVESLATRAAFGEAFNAVAAKLPSLLGGNADLAGSTKATVKDAGNFLPEERGGRNIHFGVREHAMGAAANGIALYAGLRAYTATFFVFSDFMRPTIRLAALMKLPVLFVFSHDSIGVGEDGPTHQPVEHIAALRAIPNLYVFRPGDAHETAWALKLALQRTEGPSALLTTRQKLPVISRRSTDADKSTFEPVENMARGGYVIAESEADPQALILATGSEVALALEAHSELVAQGFRVRVVSLPCWELFRDQDDEYRRSVIPEGVTARVAVEAGVRQGWCEWVGDKGEVISMERFGESAPGATLFKEFGFTVERVVDAVRRQMEKAGD